MLPGTLVLVLGFFCILHSWLNAFAEMLKFADRMFYKVMCIIAMFTYLLPKTLIMTAKEKRKLIICNLHIENVKQHFDVKWCLEKCTRRKIPRLVQRNFVFLGLVEFHIVCKLLSYMECCCPWLAVCLLFSRFSLGKWQKCFIT